MIRNVALPNENYLSHAFFSILEIYKEITKNKIIRHFNLIYAILESRNKKGSSNMYIEFIKIKYDRQVIS